MAENVRVIVRCRPMNKTEIDLNCKCVVRIRNCVVEIWDPNEGPSFPKQFTFDSTYDQDSNTEVIYNDICYPLAESVLEGYNATIFVYGQTGCGKSFTMEGIKSDNGAQKGIISRAFEHIFEAISVTSGVKYLALVSYLEIYNEQIRDLLLPNDKLTSTPLTLKESPHEGVTVPGLTSHPVHNAGECEYFLAIGSKNRMIGATLMNQNSSRSHSIFTISIEQISTTNNNESIRKGKLNLVDLAGSERQTKTGATGERLKEATKINLSLSALGNVISALVDGKATHIPYRDSKLTRLLQQKFDQCQGEDIIGSYFQPTMKRANELLSQSSRLDANKVINTWRGLPSNHNDLFKKKPLRLEALPNIKNRWDRINTMEFL